MDQLTKKKTNNLWVGSFFLETLWHFEMRENSVGIQQQAACSVPVLNAAGAQKEVLCPDTHRGKSSGHFARGFVRVSTSLTLGSVCVNVAACLLGGSQLHSAPAQCSNGEVLVKGTLGAFIPRKSFRPLSVYLRKTRFQQVSEVSEGQSTEGVLYKLWSWERS